VGAVVRCGAAEQPVVAQNARASKDFVDCLGGAIPERDT
jgi:hypothetical protein